MLHQYSNYVAVKQMHITKKHINLVGPKPFG